MSTFYNKSLISFLSILFFTYTTSHAQSLYFTWSMDEHFEECAKAYNSTTHLYDKNILKSKEGWVVRFEINNPSNADYTYTWNIQGTGDYAQYHKVYTTPLSKLFAMNPIQTRINVFQKVSVSKATIKNKSVTGNIQKRRDPVATGNPRGRPTPTAMQVERFPGVGTYVVMLTAKQNNSSGIQTFRLTVTLTNYLIVCIGDSFNSGEGNPLFPGEPGRFFNKRACDMESLSAMWYANGDNDNTISLERPASWLEELANRSLSSGAAIAARMVELNDPHSVVTFINFATSGAKTGDGLLSQQYDWQTSGQIDEVRNTIGNTPVTALLLSIGINDLDFTDMLTYATKFDFDRSYKQNNANYKMAQLPLKYYQINDAIHRKINVSNIIVTEYPWPIFSTENDENARGCELFDIVSSEDHILGVTGDEAILFHEIGQDLSLAMKETAIKYNWNFIDGIANAFKGHGYCANNSYYIHARESCLTQGNIKGTMHPNIKGHEIVGKKIYEILKKVLLPFKKPNTN